MAMNSTKKILYSVTALIIVSGVAFLFSQRDTLLGSFTAMTVPSTRTDMNVLINTTSIEDAATYAATEDTNAQTAAAAAGTDASDAADAWTANDRSALSSAQSAATSDGNDAKTAADNAANYVDQAQAFYDADYSTWQTAKDTVSADEVSKSLLYSSYAATQYSTDITHQKWDYALWMAWTFDISCIVDSSYSSGYSCTGTYSGDAANIAYSEFNSCISEDTYNISSGGDEGTTTLKSQDCYSQFEDRVNYYLGIYSHDLDYLESLNSGTHTSDFNWSDNATDAFDRMNRELSIFNYEFSHYKSDYDTKTASSTTAYNSYMADRSTYVNDSAIADNLKAVVDSDAVVLNTALASADDAASYASQGLSSKNLADSYQFLSCTSLTLNPGSYEMASTDTGAAFDLTASISTGDTTSAYKFSLQNLMTFSLSEFSVDTSITGIINAYPVTTYTAQTKWFGTLVFKSNDASTAAEGSFKIGPKTGNPLELSKTDTTDTTVAFSGGAAGDTIRVYVKNEQDSCSQSFAITQAAAVTPAGITLTESGTTAVTEGSTTTDSYTIALNAAPTADVTVTVTPDAQITVTPSTLTFTTGNWATAQTVTVTAVNDTTVEGTHSGVIKHTVTSTDTAYNGLSLSSVTATVTDNDTAGATITESSSSTAVTEGSTATDSYTVALNTAPTADVTITVTPDAQITVSPSTLTFTTSNWATAQTVTITAVNDTTVEGTHSGVIKHTVASTDTNYSGLALSSVTATITDNDTSTASNSVSTSSSCGTYLPFIDVATDNFAYNYINQLYCTGVVQGRSTTLFVPDGANGNVTYAELVKMIDIALLKKTSSDGSNLTVSFSNVHTDDWFRNYWAIAEDARVVRNYDSFAYTIDPNENIPREVVALYVARALGATATNFTAPFSDVTDLTDPYAYAIYALSHLSVTVDGVSTTVITGVDSTHFNPTDFISRSEAATIVYRASLSL